MAVKLSKAELMRANDRLTSLRNRIGKIKQEAEETTAKFVRTAEVGSAAFAMGVIQGRTGGVELFGVPLELLAGVGLNLGGYFGMAGRMSDHLNHIGDGALAAYLTTLGRGVGQEWAEKAEGTKEVTSGHLSPREIANAANAA